MDENTVRRLFTDAEEPVSPPPDVDRFVQASRRRRIGIVGINGVAAIAVVTIGMSVLDIPSTDAPHEVQDAPEQSGKVECPPGVNKKSTTYDYMGPGFPSPRQAIGAMIGDDVAQQLAHAPDHPHVFYLRRSNGDIGARYTVTPATKNSQWIPYTGEACANLPLMRSTNGARQR